MGGLDVVRRLKDEPRVPVIVIVTAYDRFAIQAFEGGAIDYPLKPVGQERLAKAVDRAKRLTAREAMERVGRLQEIAEPVGGRRSRKIVGRIASIFFSTVMKCMHFAPREI
jgi:two-component system LytT family response regulator